MMIPIVVGALGTVPKGRENRLGEQDKRKNDTIPIKALEIG